jgi:two-component sensor histidine kinase
MKRRRQFESVPESVMGARQFVSDCVTGVSRDVLDTLLVIASELATNSVRHGATGFEIRVEQTPEQILIEVEDDGSGEPVVRTPGTDETSGRGLQIVKGLSDQWGVTHARRSSGKTVWAMISLPAAHSGHEGELATPVG